MKLGRPQSFIFVADVALTGFVAVAASGCSGPNLYQPHSTGINRELGASQLPDGDATNEGGNADLQGTAQYHGTGNLAVADSGGSSLNNYGVAKSQLTAEVRSSVFTLTSFGAELTSKPKSDKVTLDSMNRQTVYNIAPSATWPAGDTNYSQNKYLVFAKSFTGAGSTFTADKPFPVFPVKQSAARDFGALAALGKASFTVTFNGNIVADYTVTRVYNSDLPGCRNDVFAGPTALLGDTVNTIGIKIAVALRGGDSAYGKFPATSMVFVNDFRNGGAISMIGSCSPSYNKDKNNLAYLSMTYLK